MSVEPNEQQNLGKYQIAFSYMKNWHKEFVEFLKDTYNI